MGKLFCKTKTPSLLLLLSSVSIWISACLSFFSSRPSLCSSSFKILLVSSLLHSSFLNCFSSVPFNCTFSFDSAISGVGVCLIDVCVSGDVVIWFFLFLHSWLFSSRCCWFEDFLSLNPAPNPKFVAVHPC